MGDHHHHTSNSHDQLRKICAGALTGISERVVSHPIETCKVVLQATPASTSAMQALSSRLSQQGFFSFYRGIVPSTLGRAIQTSIRFNVTEAVTVSLATTSFWAVFVGGITAGVVDTFVMAPVESTKTRTQASGSSWLSTFLNTWKKEGLSGYYRGIEATLLRGTVNLGLRYSIFFSAESLLDRHFGDSQKDHRPPWIPLVAGGAAGGISAYLTNPFDLVKTQMQAYKGASRQDKLSIFDAVRRIHAQPQRLWTKWFRGAWIRVTQQAPSVAVQFFLYRMFEQMLTRVV